MQLRTLLMTFSYSQPVEITFGAGARAELAAVMRRHGLSRGILVADASLVANGRAEEIMRSAVLVALFDGFGANPDITAADKAAETAKKLGADCVVGLGGGSAMDLAKFTALVAKSGKSAEELFYGTLPDEALPVIAMPATAGTGSEVTGVSVMSDAARGAKKPLTSPAFFATAAIVDPELTLTVPPFVTAASGLDAIAHALEAFWCKKHNPICDALAEKALKLLFGSMEKAYKDSGDVCARNDMSLGALTAGLAFAPTRTAAVHACSYPLSEIYHLSHGEACAFTLDLFTKLNAQYDNDRMTALAVALGFGTPEKMAEEIARLKKVTGMRAGLGEIGCADIRGLAEACAAHPLMQNNTVAFSADELEKAFGGLR